MPKCKNDPTQFYVGTEPSPLGLGISAKAEDKETTKQGKDGNMWIVSNDDKKEWEEYQTYPYVSIIIWTDNLKKNFKNSEDIESPELFQELKPIFNYLDDNEVSYELGWSKVEVDLELYDNFNFLDKLFYQKIKNVKNLTSKPENRTVRRTEILLIKLDGDEEVLIEL